LEIGAVGSKPPNPELRTDNLLFFYLPMIYRLGSTSFRKISSSSPVGGGILILRSFTGNYDFFDDEYFVVHPIKAIIIVRRELYLQVKNL